MRNISKIALVAALGLALALTFSCSGDGGSSPKRTVKKEKISGVSQKGSFVSGGTIKLYELNENYERTGKVFSGQIKDDNGRYEIDEIKGYELASPYVEVEATGRYINEITNAVSSESITLKVIADIADKDNVNINVFTHLEHDKVLGSAKKGLSFEEAKQQALAEVSAELGIAASGNSEDMNIQADSVLLLASVLLQVGRSESELSTLLSTSNGISDVKNGMAEALAVFDDARDNVLGITPSSSSVFSSSSVVLSSSSFESSSSAILSSSSTPPSSSSIAPSSNSKEKRLVTCEGGNQQLSCNEDINNLTFQNNECVDLEINWTSEAWKSSLNMQCLIKPISNTTVSIKVGDNLEKTGTGDFFINMDFVIFQLSFGKNEIRDICVSYTNTEALPNGIACTLQPR